MSTMINQSLLVYQLIRIVIKFRCTVLSSVSFIFRELPVKQEYLSLITFKDIFRAWNLGNKPARTRFVPRLCHCKLRNQLDANADVNSCYPARKNTSSYWHDPCSECYCRRID